MRYIIGQETCQACGAKLLTVTRPDSGLSLEASPCERCGAPASTIAVLHPLMWPEIEALVAFDDERQRLRLPPIAGPTQ
jgi:predicted amidophosphoribosyltransferase